jgi:hypothetical protein
MLPAPLTPGNNSNYSPRPPDEIMGNTLSWIFDSLAVGATQSITFEVTTPVLTGFGATGFLNVVVAEGPAHLPAISSRDSTGVAIAAQGILECYLDRNTWKPDIDPPLGVNFGLTATSFVRIKIHDLAGTLIRNLVDRVYDAGQHRVEWDGRTNAGLTAGSGLYVVTFESRQFIDWKKLIIVR